MEEDLNDDGEMDTEELVNVNNLAMNVLAPA